MHRCLIETNRLLDNSILLTREESRHIRNVLRLKDGAVIELFDGAGRTREAEIIAVGKNLLTLNPVTNPELHPSPKCSLTLLVCISKGKRIDWSIEKATELGVMRVVPIISERTIVRLNAAERQHKQERWQRVAEDAARQCGSAWVPQIDSPLEFAEASAVCAQSDVAFTAALSSDAIPLRNALRNFTTTPSSALWFTGPEGDFTEAELQELRANNVVLVNLGTNILRAETAAVYGLCVLNCLWL